MSEAKDYYVYTHSLKGQPPFYIGKGLKKRADSISRKHNQYHTNIVNKYGIENIIVRAMLCRSEQHALDLEIKLIAALRNDGVKLVNCTDGGEGISGHKHSEETKAKISDGNKGKILSEETKAKMSDKIVSPETIAKLTGRTRSEESRAKMSEAARLRIANNKLAEENKSPSVDLRSLNKILNLCFRY